MSGRLISRIKSFNRWQWAVVIAFILALAFTAFYSYRTYKRAEFWREHQNQPIAEWMRVGFVANSYRVPLPDLNKAVGLPPDARDRRPLGVIAEEQGRPFAELKSALEAAILDHRSKSRPPGGDPR